MCIACSLLILADESSFSLHSAAYCQLDGIMRGRQASSADALVPCISCIGPIGDLDVVIKIQISFLFYMYIFRSYDNGLGSKLQDLSVDKSMLVQVMAWCR